MVYPADKLGMRKGNGDRLVCIDLNRKILLGV